MAREKNNPPTIRLSVAPALALAGLALAPSVQAQMQPAGPASLLPEVAVSATRFEEEIKDIPATITRTDAQQIDRGLVQNIQDLIRYEPGVSVSNDPSRFGAAGFNIRGLDGNRVGIVVDGIRASSFYRFGIGPFNTSTRNFVDLDSVKAVEILRGPASSLYGSDALGGVVSYVTKDPLDYLDLKQAPYYAALKSLYASSNNGWSNTATVAGGTSQVQALLVYTYYTGNEMENFGDNGSTGPLRTEPNPQDTRENNVLAKIVFTPDANNTFRGVYENYSRDSSTNILSLNASTPTTSALTGTDDATRERYGLDYEFRNPVRGWFAGFRASVYQQISQTQSDSTETRSRTSATCSGVAPGASTCLIPREFDFSQRVTGANAMLESVVDSGSVNQRILWGLDYFTTTSAGLRNALRINQTTGTVSNQIAGDSFPVRDFPISKTDQFGAFVQDQIYLLDNQLVITPALRYDEYQLEVQPDSIFLSNTPPGVRAQDFKDSAVSPKLAALYKINPELNVYGQYAFGFRAPPFDDLNASFRNPVQSYALVPNPELKSEESRGFELGLKGETSNTRFALAAFYNKYKDFIDSSTALNCPANPACVPGFLITFQSINRASVRIYGAEASGEYRFAPNWGVAGSIAYANGEDTTLGQPINTINPLTAVAGLRYFGTGGQYGGALNVTAVQRKTDAANVGGVAPFLTPGFGTVDLTGYWNINAHARLAAGVFNILNKKYWLWTDTSSAGLTAGTPWVDRYTQPGINASVNLQIIL